MVLSLILMIKLALDFHDGTADNRLPTLFFPVVLHLFELRRKNTIFFETPTVMGIFFYTAVF